MNLRLYDNDSTDVFVEKEYPAAYRMAEEGLHESEIRVNHPSGSVYYKEIYFEGVHIGYGSALLAERVLLNFESDFSSVEMHFALKGKSTARSERFTREVSFDAHQHNIIYANQMCGKMQWESEEFQLCEINLAPDFFLRLLPEGDVFFDKFRDAVQKGNSDMMSRRNNQISHQMYQIINQIMNCERKGAFKKMFLEAKVIELLLLQLEQISEDHQGHSSLRKADIDRIYAVREYMLRNLDHSCSLVDLAHHVGTNEFMLKKGFRELFGTTVIGFWNDAKMQQARVMLTEHAMNVGEVSDNIGYKNQRHFSAAFKRKYGILPSQLKR